MDNLKIRKIIKAKRRNKDTWEIGNSIKKVEIVRSDGNKRKHDLLTSSSQNNFSNKREIECNNLSRSTTKFSANDRLKKYRASLNERQNEVIKVHQVLNTSKCRSDECEKNTDLNNSVNMNKCILGKRPFNKETDRIQQSDNEVHSKKSKINKTRENTKLSDSINVNKDLYNPDDMDWSPIDENEIISNIQKYRDSCKEKPFSFPDATPSILASNTTGCLENSIEVKELYIVVDTNIFISHLYIIQDILSEECKEYNLTVYVPWIVIQELDYFKDGRSESSLMIRAAKRAIKFINENLLKKNSKLKGQTVQEALRQKESSSNADDNILFFCIHLAETSKTVVLLSNDVNLRNKALINNITSYGPKDVLRKIKEFHMDVKNNQKICQISSVIANVCTEIILKEMEEAYGSVLYKLITKPPWDLKQCLTYIKRFWNPVFSLLISQKQCLKIVEDLLMFVQSCNDLSTDKNMENFIKLCLSLCVYFKNCLNKHEKIVMNCINNIQKIIS